MSTITAGIAYQFVRDQIAGVHNLETDTLKLALYNTLCVLNRTTILTYTTTNECVGTGYVAGGNVVTVASVVYIVGSLPGLDFVDTLFSAIDLGNAVAAQAIQGGLLYNTSKSNKVIAVIDFGPAIIVNGGNLTIEWPAAPTAATAFIRGLG